MRKARVLAIPQKIPNNIGGMTYSSRIQPGSLCDLLRLFFASSALSDLVFIFQTYNLTRKGREDCERVAKG